MPCVLQAATAETELTHVRIALSEREAIVQSKMGELLSTQAVHAEAVRRVCGRPCALLCVWLCPCCCLLDPPRCKEHEPKWVGRS